MASTLSRLYTYAKASQNDTRENFTTEALAAAIRHDSAPMLAILREACVPHVTKLVAVHTQMTVPNVGIVDVVLAFEDGAEVWVEVKVDAGESGNQLDHYRAHLRRMSPQSSLVTLGKDALRADVTALTWQELRRAIDGATTSPYWTDLRAYLEEIRVADSYDEPLVDAERTALATAHSLLRKVARMIVPVAKHASSLAPSLEWPDGEDEVLRDVAAQFRTHGTLNFYSHVRRRAGISVVALPDGGDTGLGVWVWNKPSVTSMRRQVLERADLGKLPPSWERTRIGWKGLGIYTALRRTATQLRRGSSNGSTNCTVRES